MGRGESALGASLGLGGQFERTLQKRRGRRRPGASLSRSGHPFELLGDGLVRSRRRRREVPDATLRIELGIGRGGERRMRGDALVGRRARVRRGAHQRVAKAHPGADLQQLFRLGRGGRVTRDAKRLRRTPEKRRIPGRVSRRHKQQSPRRLRKRAQAPRKMLLDRLARRERPKATGQLRGLIAGGSSSSFNGFPRVSATIRSRTCSSR
jgi:hypothetical protein